MPGPWEKYSTQQPAAQSGPWAAYAQPDAPSLTDNAKGEGLYRMAAPDRRGTYIAVPFSKVQDAQQQGYKFQDQATGDRWHADYQATLPMLDRVKDAYQYRTRDVAGDGSDTDGSVVQAALQNVGGHIGRVLVHTVAHPVDAATDLVKTAADVADPRRIGPPQFVKDMYHSVADSPDKAGDVERLVGDLGGNVLLGELGGEAMKGAKAAAGKVGSVAADATARFAAGGKLDELIPGDTVSPRERYQAAQRMGVNLDLAQATNGSAAKMAKTVSEHSLLGKGNYEALQAANRDALNAHAAKTLDAVAPEMPREQLGNAVKQALQNHQAQMNGIAGEIYENLDKHMSDVKPDQAGIAAVAQRIVDENKQYYQDHPEMLHGGTRRAWDIVNRLADGKGTDSWTNLHKFRTDLLDMTRGPEFVGNHATGWLKQVTAAVDGAMTNPDTLDPLAQESFREANDVYGRMKALYDTPQSKFYQMARAADGIKASQFLDSLTPEEFRYVAKAAPELVRAIRRYTMERILSPAGNDLPDWTTLTSRFGRTQKEVLAGKLTPAQIQQMEDMARVSRAIGADSNPSGTAKMLVPIAEGGAVAKGGYDLVGGIVTGNPVQALSGAKEVATPLVNKAVAKVVTSPKVVARVMRGPEAWAARGAKNLVDAGADARAVEALKKTPRGRRLLQEASDLTKGSRAMRGVLARLSSTSTSQNP